MAIPLGRIIRKYGAVVFFPTFTVATIYADWSHTQRWKREIRDKLKIETVELQ